MIQFIATLNRESKPYYNQKTTINSIKRTLFFLILFAIVPLPSYAKNITGKVVDKRSGETIVGATIFLVDQNKGTITDINGEFQLSKEGLIRVSFIGYKTVEVKVQNDPFLVQLEEDNETLESIEIVGRFSKKYNSEYTYSATKIAAKTTELPQSVSTVTKELMLDRQAFRLGDVVKNISGVSTVSFYNHYAIRGITQSSGDRENRYINGMRTSQIYFNQPLSSNIERVEVVKGPSSITFSNTDAGGTMNMVTKKPLMEERKQVSLNLGSFNTVRGALDFTGPINEDKTLLYRLNVGYENSLSFRDLMFKKAYLIAPTISYLPNDKTRINVELVYSHDQSRVDRGQPIFLNEGDEEIDLNSTSKSLSIGAPNDYYNVKDQLVNVSLSHSFSKHLTLNAAYQTHAWDEDLSEYRSTFSNAVSIDSTEVPDLLNMKMHQRKQKWYTDNISVFLNHTMYLGRAKLQNVIGTDYIKFKNTEGSGTQTAQGYLSSDGSTSIDTFDPNRPNNYSYMEYHGIKIPVPNVPYFNIANPSYEFLDMNEFYSEKEQYPTIAYQTQGFYFMNRTEFGRFILDLGVRREVYIDYENYNKDNEVETEQSAWLPKVGLTVKAHDNFNVYGGYSRSYQPQTAAVINNPKAGGPFDPLQSRMFEVGLKSSFFDDMLHANIALFDIEQKNILISAMDPSNTDLMRQRGKETSKGLELELMGNITPNLNVNVAYAYIDAKIEEDSNGLAGQRKENTPKNSLSIWTKYNFSQPKIDGFGIGFGLNYVGEKLPWYSRDFVIPAYCSIDAALYYQIKNLNLAINVNNLTDKGYWYGAINHTNLYPAPPRNGMFSVTYNF